MRSIQRNNRLEFVDDLENGFTALNLDSIVTLPDNGNLADVISKIGSNNRTLVIDRTITEDGTVTIPSNVTLKFIQGGMIGGYGDLTINGFIEARTTQVFGGSLTLDVAGQTEVNASWFYDLPAAISAIGSYNVDLLVDESIVISEDVTIPDTANLVFSKRGVIDSDTTANTLTINGVIQAGLWQVFGSTLTVNGIPKISKYPVQWRGAIADGSTDVSTEINQAFDDIRAFVDSGAIVTPVSDINPNQEQSIAPYFPFGQYLVQSTLWTGADETSGENVTDAVKNIEADVGAIIIGQTNGSPVIDNSGCFNSRWENLTIMGAETNSPNIGVLLARSGTSSPNPSAGDHYFENIKIFNKFSLCSVYNYGSEINKWSNSWISNNHPSSRAAYIQTYDNVNFAVTSDFTTIGTGPQSSYADTFVETDLKFDKADADKTTDGCIIIESLAYGPKFTQCYFDLDQSDSTPCSIIRETKAGGEIGTSRITQGLSLINCVVEQNYDSVLRVEGKINDLTMLGNSFGSVTPVTADIVITSGADLVKTDIQAFRGDSQNNPVTINNSGTFANKISKETDVKPAYTGSYQFTEADLTLDNIWNSLDLSTYIPVEARYVYIVCEVRHDGTISNSDFFGFREPGVGNEPEQFRIYAQVSGVIIHQEGWVKTSGGSVEYIGVSDHGVVNIAAVKYQL